MSLCKKTFNLFCTFILVITMIMPTFSVEAANSYSVVMVSNTSNNKTIGSYSTYSEAVKVMNNQKSTSTSVASIYKNGKIINSKYAIFQFSANTDTINLYQNSGDLIAYTYTRPSSMTDSAFLDSNESRVQIMLNGFKGWVDINSGTIIPISLLNSNAIKITATGLNLRSSSSTSSKSLGSITCTNSVFTYTEKTTSGGYTWYKINYNGTTGWVASGSWLTETTGDTLNTYYYKYSTGNLLHRYAYHNGTSYSDTFTNLGPSPSYLTEGVHYYSFDGIYLYTSLTSMLDDYKSSSYSKSINGSNPNYSYYLYLPNKSVSKITAEQLDSQITNTSSKLYGQGKYFKEAEELYGMNALSAFATAKNESANGTSAIAIDKNNVFGYGASDNCPYECAYSYSSVRESIIDYAKNGLSSYMTAEGKYYFGTHAGNKGSGRNVKYASDPLWGEKQAAYAYSTDLKANLRDYKANTIGITKYGKYNIAVYSDSNDSKVLYYMRNSNSDLKVYNVPVTVIDKINGYYKIYADSSSSNHGYIKESDLYVSNNQPIITASDKEILLNSSFNATDGVTATDTEDGDLTNKMTTSGTVDTSKVGTYKVTYKVTDSSNFSVSKTVNIVVKGSSEPVINASDVTISQYTSFDYMDGVTAIDDKDGNLTSKVTYDGEVNTDKVGEYKVTYSVTNSDEKTTSKTITIKVKENSKPVIEATDKTVYLNNSFDYMDGVSASDDEDGTLTSKITYEGSVNTSEIGEYEVTYTVTDSTGQNTSKKIKVTVTEKQLKEANGWFHIEDLSFSNDTMEITGFEVITGVSNAKKDDIKYELILENQDTGEEITFNLEHMTDNIPFVPNDGTKNDYSGSWFNGNIDLSSIVSGDYTMYIKAYNSDYYVKEKINNSEYNEDITRKYKDSNNRGYTVRENKSSISIDLELFVRDDGLISYGTTPVWSGLYNDFFNYDFNNDKLNIVGSSYALATDYKSNDTVEREIIFEDASTHKVVYTQKISSTNGPYKISSNTNNDLSQGWFKASVDVSNLDKGSYIIYIKTKVNDVEDYNELSDYAYSTLDKTLKINNKTISLVRKNSQRARLELVIE